MVDLNVAGVCFNGFLRFFEFLWIGPILYGKEAYSTSDYLYKEFWSALCKFPKPSKKNDDEKPKEYVKDKVRKLSMAKTCLKLIKHHRNGTILYRTCCTTQ